MRVIAAALLAAACSTAPEGRSPLFVTGPDGERVPTPAFAPDRDPAPTSPGAPAMVVPPVVAPHMLSAQLAREAEAKVFGFRPFTGH